MAGRRQAGRQAATQAGRQAGREAGRQKDKQAGRGRDRGREPEEGREEGREGQRETIKFIFSSKKQLFSKSNLHSPNLCPLGSGPRYQFLSHVLRAKKCDTNHIPRATAYCPLLGLGFRVWRLGSTDKGLGFRV